ncbi:MAG: hypothetical protein R2706_09475 [Acidimicrobiales bacterium]
MRIESAASLPFAPAHDARCVELPTKLSWQQLLRAHNVAIFLRLGTPKTIVYSLYQNTVFLLLLVVSARSGAVRLWLLLAAAALFSPWSPLVVVVDVVVSMARGHWSWAQSHWTMDRHGLRHDPVVPWGTVDWGSVTGVGRRGDVVIVVHERKLGVGLAAHDGITVEEIVAIADANTGVATKRMNALAYTLAFGPWS